MCLGLSRNDNPLLRLLFQFGVGQQSLRNLQQRVSRGDDLPIEHVRLRRPSDELPWHVLLDPGRSEPLWGELHSMPAPPARDGDVQQRYVRNRLQPRLQRVRRLDLVCVRHELGPGPLRGELHGLRCAHPRVL